MSTELELKAWLKTRPECVQRLAEEFPIPAIVQGPNGRPYHLMGYNESDMLILSPVDAVDYEDALARKIYVCAQHYRKPIE